MGIVQAIKLMFSFKSIGKSFSSYTAFDYLTGKVNRFQSKRSLPSDTFRKR